MPVTGNKSLVSYSLSIRHHADGFSFYVHSTGSGTEILREDIKKQDGEEAHAALERGLCSKRISRHGYERVNMLVATPSTRLPLDEFRRDDMLAIYRTVFHDTTARREDIRFQVLPALEVVELFTLSPQIEHTLHLHYPGAVIQGLYGSVLQHISEIQQGSTMPLSFHAIPLEDQVLIVQLRQGRLTYANTFQATRPEDQLYYILYTWKLFELDTHHDVCTIYNASKELLALTRDFIVNVRDNTLEL